MFSGTVPKFKDPSDVFFSSDLHFDHKGVLAFCPDTRPYSSADEMNRELIDAINGTVRKDSTFYHLGDLCFSSDMDNVKKHLRAIKCQNIHLIMGNHDLKLRAMIPELLSLGLIKSAEDYSRINIGGHTTVLCHYPMSVWDQCNRGSFQLFGHCHGTFQSPYRQMDVGWDSKELQYPLMRPFMGTEIIDRLLSKADHFETKSADE